ncbi:MAG TPA: hypothetical protein VIV40_10085 [Kofleriaceae bacterium]
MRWWWVLGWLALVACMGEMPPDGTGDDSPPPGPQCGDCASSEYCPNGYYCDTNPCLIDCTCSNPACWGTCAGVCTPYTGPYCGDGTCGGTETCDNCSKDCACVCGNGKCEHVEDCDACATDCACEACTNAIDMPSPGGLIGIGFSYEHDSVDGSCASGEGAERIIRFTQGQYGQMMEARVASSYFLVTLSVRSVCEQAATEIRCATQLVSSDPASIIFYVAAQQTAYIIVEAPSPPLFGSFSATIRVSAI